jgi:hypothetical protein
MQIEIVSVHRDRRIRELDDQLDAIPLGPRGELQQWMLVKTKLSKDTFQAKVGGIRHGLILAEGRAESDRQDGSARLVEEPDRPS